MELDNGNLRTFFRNDKNDWQLHSARIKGNLGQNLSSRTSPTVTAESISDVSRMTAILVLHVPIITAVLNSGSES